MSSGPALDASVNKSENRFSILPYADQTIIQLSQRVRTRRHVLENKDHVHKIADDNYFARFARFLGNSNPSKDILLIRLSFSLSLRSWL